MDRLSYAEHYGMMRNNKDGGGRVGAGRGGGSVVKCSSEQDSIAMKIPLPKLTTMQMIS